MTTTVEPRTAGGGLPEDVTFEHVPDRGTEGRGVIGPGAMISAKVDGKEIGGLAWFTTFVAGPMGHQAGQIEGVYVHDDYQRRGLATEMLRRAREIEPRIHHSHALTEEGRAWSERVGASSRAGIEVEKFTRRMGRQDSYEGVVRSDRGQQLAYRGFGSWEEAREALRSGRWTSQGMFTVPGEGQTQMALSLGDVIRNAGFHSMRGTGFLGAIEADVSGLPFRTFMGRDVKVNKDGTAVLKPDLGLGIGIDYGLPVDRIRKVFQIKDGKVAKTWNWSDFASVLGSLEDEPGWSPELEHKPASQRAWMGWNAKGAKNKVHRLEDDQRTTYCGKTCNDFKAKARLPFQKIIDNTVTTDDASLREEFKEKPRRKLPACEICFKDRNRPWIGRPMQRAAAAVAYFHASDHSFAPGDRIVPGVEIGKAGLSGGEVVDSGHVWVQDDVHEIYSYGEHLYEVRPTGPVEQVFPHVYRTSGAEVVREIAVTDRAEYVELAERLKREAASAPEPAHWSSFERFRPPGEDEDPFDYQRDKVRHMVGTGQMFTSKEHCPNCGTVTTHDHLVIWPDMVHSICQRCQTTNDTVWPARNVTNPNRHEARSDQSKDPNASEQMINTELELRAQMPKGPHVYSSVADILKRHGRRWDHVSPTPYPGMKIGPMGACYSNALHAAIGSRGALIYCEGMALHSFMPMAHAWCVDGNGVVYDPTWEKANSYFGIPFDTTWLAGHVLAKGTDSVFGDDIPGPALQEIFTKGLPPAAIHTMAAKTGKSAALYHVAPRSAREDIQQHGIDRGRGQSPWADAPVGFREFPLGNYLWTDLDAARRYVFPGQESDIWEVDTEGLTLDEDALRTPDSVVVGSPVPASSLRLMQRRTAMPSWRDRGERPEAEVLIVPDLGRARRNSYSVYHHGQPAARRGSLEEAKAYAAEQYGITEWTRVPGDQRPHHDEVWGQTNMFNDAKWYLVPKTGAAKVHCDDCNTDYFVDGPEEIEEHHRRHAGILDSLNPTGGVFVDYDPTSRATSPLGPNLTTLAETQGVPAHTPLTIYRGAPANQSTIAPGDFVTTNRQLAEDYGGTVLTLTTTYGEVLDDRTEPGGEEYIYRPGRTASRFPGGTIYRGLRATFSPEVEARLKDLLAMETDEESYAKWKDKGGKRVQAGELIVRALEKSSWDEGVGLGRHWSERREMASIGAMQGGQGDWSILLTATYDPSDIDPEWDPDAPFMQAENEVRLKPGADITVTQVDILNPNGVFTSKGERVSYRSIRAKAGLQVEAYFPGEVEQVMAFPGRPDWGGPKMTYTFEATAKGERCGTLQLGLYTQQKPRSEEWPVKEGEDYFHVEGINVAPKWRRAGVATGLWEKVHEQHPGIKTIHGTNRFEEMTGDARALLPTLKRRWPDLHFGSGPGGKMAAVNWGWDPMPNQTAGAERMPIEQVLSYCFDWARDGSLWHDQPSTTDYMNGLVDSIRRDGLKKPVVLRRNEDGSISCVDGNHRAAAAKRAGEKTVPIVWEKPWAKAAARTIKSQDKIRLPNPRVQVKQGTPNTSAYRGVGFSGQAWRFWIEDPNAPDWMVSKAEFAPDFGQPMMGNFEGSTDKTVAYLDVFDVGDWIDVAFMTTRGPYGGAGDYTRQGLAGKLMQACYDKFEPKKIYWGKIMHDGAQALKDRFRREMPERTGVHQKQAVYFMHDVNEPLIDTKPMHEESSASFQFVHPQIATGGAIRRTSDLRILYRRGIRGIVSGRRDFDDSTLAMGRDMGIAFLDDPTADDGQPKPTSWFKKALDFCLPILRRGEKVYLHCHSGVNRGPSLAYCVLRAWTGMGHEQAVHAIESQRDIVRLIYTNDADKALFELGYIKERGNIPPVEFKKLPRWMREKIESGEMEMSHIDLNQRASALQAVDVGDIATDKPQWLINGKPYHDETWIEVKPDVWYRGTAYPNIPARFTVQRRDDKWVWQAQVLTFIGAPHEDRGWDHSKSPKGTAKTLEAAQAKAEASIAKDHEFFRRYDERQKANLAQTEIRHAAAAWTGQFLGSDCLPLAIEVARKRGWGVTVVADIGDEDEFENVWHAWARKPDGSLVDIEGQHPASVATERAARHGSEVHTYATAEQAEAVGGYMEALGEVDPEDAADYVIQRFGAAMNPLEFTDPHYAGPSKGMWGPPQPNLDPRIFEGDHMRPDVRAYVLSSLDAYWTPLYGDWRKWTTVYLAGSAAAYWWSSDTDLDILLGIDLDVLREIRPANKEVKDEEIIAHLNAGLINDLRPQMASHVFAEGEKPFIVTYFVNPGSFDITTLKPYAAYDITADKWVVKPPVVPADWGWRYIPPETQRRAEQMAREAEEVLSLPEPERTAAGSKFFDWVHEGRKVAYSPAGTGWLDPGNLTYAYLEQHPHALLRRLYLLKHPEDASPDEVAKGQAGVTTVPEADITYLPEFTTQAMTQPRPEPDPVEYRHVQPPFWDEKPFMGGYHSMQARLDGRQIGSLHWWDPGEGPWKDIKGPFIDKVEVASEHQRKGLAAEMLRRAREITPGIKHSDKLTGPGHAWRDAVSPDEAGTAFQPAMMQHRLSTTSIPEDIHFVVHSESGNRRSINAYIGSQSVGSLVWRTDIGMMQFVFVEEAFRRRGIATALWEEAKKYQPDLRHAIEMTDQGEAWSKTVSSRTAAMSLTTVDYTVLENQTGGSKWPTWSSLSLLVDGRKVGAIDFYLSKTRRKVLIDLIGVSPQERGKGYASALMDELQRRFPDASIDHGDRTDEGKAWWAEYSRGKSIRRGRTAGRMGLWWRVHPEGRAFGDWDAHSHPFFIEGLTEWKEGDPVQPGYSCYENPWHLYFYVLIQWGGAISPETTVLRFPGERVGTGHDGEDLAVPTGLPMATTWGNFVRMLPEQQLPASPRFATWVTRSEMRTWEALAERWAYLDQEKPEQDFIITKFAPRDLWPRRLLAGTTASLTAVGTYQPVKVKAEEIVEGDRLDRSGKVRVTKPPLVRGDKVTIAYRLTGSRSPSIRRYMVGEQVTVYRAQTTAAKKLVLWRAEGPHDTPSAYVTMGKPELAGGFYTRDRNQALSYAEIPINAGKVVTIYRLEVDEEEIPGADRVHPTFVFVRDPAVKDRRVADEVIQREGARVTASPPSGGTVPEHTRQVAALGETAAGHRA